MKTKTKTIRLLFATAVLGAVASLVQAGPGPQYWEKLTNEAQFGQLKAGEKVAYVCNVCKTVSEIPVTSHEHAMELCKMGATVTCPSCKITTKVVMKGGRNDPSAHNEVVYVNEKGEECAFIAKVPGGKLETLGNESQFHSLKAGDKVAYVCNVCKTVSEIAVASHEHAMGFCKEGATVTCPSCKKTTKVVMKGGRNDPPSHSVVIYVNEKGEECAFMAKVAE
ncbi:MAG: hypothetical protein ABIY47_08420 [Opitutaceae bacterium]